MTVLQEVADGLWVASAESKFLVFHVGTRMTVVRLSSGALLLHSPVPITAALKQELDELGPVAHIVCPNNFHHRHAAQAISIYPNASLHGSEKLHKKRKDLPFTAVLSDNPHPDWVDDLVPLTIKGSMMYETIFFHPASNTLITSDIVENFETSDHWLTRGWLKLGDCHGHINWHRVLRLVYFNRKSARDSVERMFEFPFERVILAHGDMITENAHQALREGMSWLRA